MAELKPYPLKHFNLNAPEIKFEDNIFKIQQKIYVECADMKEQALLDAIIRAAREAGITELFLLDKQFVTDALAVAIEKWRVDNG